MSLKIDKRITPANNNAKRNVMKLRKRIFLENFSHTFQNFEETSFMKNIANDLPILSQRHTTKVN